MTSLFERAPSPSPARVAEYVRRFRNWLGGDEQLRITIPDRPPPLPSPLLLPTDPAQLMFGERTAWDWARVEEAEVYIMLKVLNERARFLADPTTLRPQPGKHRILFTWDDDRPHFENVAAGQHTKTRLRECIENDSRTPAPELLIFLDAWDALPHAFAIAAALAWDRVHAAADPARLTGDERYAFVADVVFLQSATETGYAPTPPELARELDDLNALMSRGT